MVLYYGALPTGSTALKRFIAKHALLQWVNIWVHYWAANFPQSSQVSHAGDMCAGHASLQHSQLTTSVWALFSHTHKKLEAHTRMIILSITSKTLQTFIEMSDVFPVSDSVIKICKWYDKMHFTPMVTVSFMLNAFNTERLLSDKAHQKCGWHGPV